MLVVQNLTSLGYLLPRNQQTLQIRAPLPNSELLQFTATRLLGICDIDHSPKQFCWNWGSCDTERKNCLLLWVAHQFNVWLCHDWGILGNTVNSYRLCLHAVNHGHYTFVSSTENMSVFVSVLCGFQGGVLVKITEACPALNCSEEDHILPEDQCCSVCRGKWARGGHAWARWQWLAMLAWRFSEECNDNGMDPKPCSAIT